MAKFNWRRVSLEERDRRARSYVLIPAYPLHRSSARPNRGRPQSSTPSRFRIVHRRRRRYTHPLSLGDLRSRVDGLRADTTITDPGTPWVPRLYRYFERQHGASGRRFPRSRQGAATGFKAEKASAQAAAALLTRRRSPE